MQTENTALCWYSVDDVVDTRLILANQDTKEIVGSVVTQSNAEYLACCEPPLNISKRFIDLTTAKKWLYQVVRNSVSGKTHKELRNDRMDILALESLFGSLDVELTRICKFLKHKYGDEFTTFERKQGMALSPKEIENLLNI
ncbi:MAG: hypothetical protein LBK82_05215 [Planctomycetaceae bacterium]|jgi:hypothetical protein|nr:hypothetical protein [Planctomycetaceae bacterium]